jgi:hypothetical protein
MVGMEDEENVECASEHGRRLVVLFRKAIEQKEKSFGIVETLRGVVKGTALTDSPRHAFATRHDFQRLIVTDPENKQKTGISRCKSYGFAKQADDLLVHGSQGGFVTLCGPGVKVLTLQSRIRL